MKTLHLITLSLLAAAAGAAQPRAPHKAWTDPATALREDPDFAVQGEYAGVGVGVQIVALVEGKLDSWLLDGGLPGMGWEPGKSRQHLTGRREAGGIVLKHDGGQITAVVEGGSLVLTRHGDTKEELKRIERRSPTLKAQPPGDGIMLFDGSSTDKWENAKIENGLLLATGCTTLSRFTSYTLHLEFRTPYMPSARGQQRGNSGVYHSGRWETQILDSFGLEGRDNECGGIYSIARPRLNMCLPPLAWQTYDDASAKSPRLNQ